MLKIKVIILSICVFAINMVAKAQFDSLNYAINGKNFIETSNASFLNSVNISTKSIAEIGAETHQGGFKNFNESDNDFNINAKVESFYRFSEKISGYGKISYNNYTGKNMTGSAFANPEESPFDIVEQSDTNSGNKKKEMYNILGGFSVKVTPNLLLGAKVDYLSSNYAKRKDLRHQNNIMDLKTSVGLNYNFDFLTVGVNYIYRRRNEGLRFSTKGTSDKTYNSIISYGGFWGIREEFGEDGFTDKSREMPLFDSYNGLGVQLLIKFNDNIQWFNDLQLLKRDGHYGRKGQYTIEYTTHEADVSQLNGNIFVTSNAFSHSLYYKLDYNLIDCYRNIYTSETFEGGLTNYIYHDQLKTSGKKIRNLNIGYQLFWFSNNNITSFETGLNFYNRELYAIKYPFYRKQNLKNKEFYVKATETINQENRKYDFNIGLNLKKGSGLPFEDGYFVQPNQLQSTPESQIYFLGQEYEYLCKPRINISLGAKYSQKMLSNRITGYVGANYTFTKGKNVNFIESTSHFVSLRVGVEF